jgi:hypothetical protein
MHKDVGWPGQPRHNGVGCTTSAMWRIAIRYCIRLSSDADVKIIVFPERIPTQKCILDGQILPAS